MNGTRTASPAMQIGLPSLQSRVLGEDFAPPRALYLSHIPAILVLTGLVTWIVGNELSMIVAATTAGAIGCYLLWEWLFREGPSRFSTILSMTLLLGYGVGAVNTWLTLPRGGLPLAAVLGADEGVLARGMAAVLISGALLCFFGELYERPLFGREFRIPLDGRTYTLIYAGTIAIIAAYFTHSLGYEGGYGVNVVGEQQSAFSGLLAWLFCPLATLTVAVFFATERGTSKLFTGICALVLCGLLMTVGLRTIIYAAVEILFALRLTGYRLKGAILKKAFLIAASGAFIAAGVTVFMLLRLAASENHYDVNTSLVQRVQIAATWVEDGTALTRAIEASQNNVQRKRTFMLGFFADVLEGSTQKTPGLGRDFMGFASMAVPRLFNPGKDLSFGEEGLDDELFGLTYKDAANSVLTSGATDFGLFGVIAYPLLFAWLTRFSVETLSKFLPSAPAAIIALGAIANVLQPENTLNGYFVTIRNAIIFSVILLIFFRLPGIRLRSQ